MNIYISIFLHTSNNITRINQTKLANELQGKRGHHRLVRWGRGASRRRPDGDAPRDSGTQLWGGVPQEMAWRCWCEGSGGKCTWISLHLLSASLIPCRFGALRSTDRQRGDGASYHSRAYHNSIIKVNWMIELTKIVTWFGRKKFIFCFNLSNLLSSFVVDLRFLVPVRRKEDKSMFLSLAIAPKPLCRFSNWLQLTDQGLLYL